MTDDKRVPDPLAAAGSLPKGSAVILRHRNDRERARLGEGLLKLARQSDLLLLIAGDPALAHRLNADGVHVPESQLASIAPCRTRHPDWIITAAVHSELGVLRASRSAADAALLAPLFHTKSHPERSEFGLTRFRLLAARAPIPIYALGGITAANAGRLAEARIAGIAAIDGVLPD
jgi:thiamine-phosphate pyrophosphorylase